jgi:hypothetical protein
VQVFECKHVKIKMFIHSRLAAKAFRTGTACADNDIFKGGFGNMQKKSSFLSTDLHRNGFLLKDNSPLLFALLVADDNVENTAYFAQNRQFFTAAF